MHFGHFAICCRTKSAFESVQGGTRDAVDISPAAGNNCLVDGALASRRLLRFQRRFCSKRPGTVGSSQPVRHSRPGASGRCDRNSGSQRRLVHSGRRAICDEVRQPAAAARRHDRRRQFCRSSTRRNHGAATCRAMGRGEADLARPERCRARFRCGKIPARRRDTGR